MTYEKLSAYLQECTKFENPMLVTGHPAPDTDAAVFAETGERIRRVFGVPIAVGKDGETELILMPPREPGTGPHVHGRVGWQHLAFAVDSRADVDRMHSIATDAGWTVVREPKEYPRFTDRYYASFVEDDNGIRIEFMHNPPHEVG